MRDQRYAFAVLVTAVLLAGGCVAAIGNRSRAPVETLDGASRYRIETVRLDDGSWSLLRYRPQTGQAWYTRSPENEVWVPILDETPITRSNYEFKTRTTGGRGWTVIRLDTRTGRSWVTKNSVWIEVEDSDDGGS